MNGAEYICQLLESRGIDQLFGLPGTQNSRLFSALRRSSIEIFVASHEMGAGFAALGYGATSSQPGVLAIIGGPGFTYALTPLQEARSDSISLVCLVFVRAHDQTKSFHTQQIEYHDIAKNFCKQVFEVSSAQSFAFTLDQAMTAATDGQPGPAMILINAAVLDEQVSRSVSSKLIPNNKIVEQGIVEDLARRISGEPLLILAGRGALCCPNEIEQLSERVGAPVITSTSARGVVPENHALAVSTDLVDVALLNEFISEFTTVLAMGIRLSENSTRGYKLHLPPEKLIHIDADPDIVGRNYRTNMGITADVPALAKALLHCELKARPYDKAKLDVWRSKFSISRITAEDPEISAFDPPRPSAFFDALRQILPEESILVCDSGTHQMLARKYYKSLSPYGLVVPTNFQSMGFAVSSAVGAKIANPDRPVIALIGDGGMQMCGLELAAAVSSRLCVVVIVFNDRRFGHIRKQQIAFDGFEYGVSLPELNLESLCSSISAIYTSNVHDLKVEIERALNRNIPTVLEVSVTDSKATSRKVIQTRAKYVLKKALGPGITRLIRSVK